MIPAYKNLRVKTRVVCFFFDKEDHVDMIKNYRNKARDIAFRTNLRVGVVTDNKLIKKLKRNKPKYFPSDEGLSACALRRYDDTYVVHDISGLDQGQVIDFSLWIN